jgi:hypothetical protein
MHVQNLIKRMKIREKARPLRCLYWGTHTWRSKKPTCKSRALILPRRWLTSKPVATILPKHSHQHPKSGQRKNLILPVCTSFCPSNRLVRSRYSLRLVLGVHVRQKPSSWCSRGAGLNSGAVFLWDAKTKTLCEKKKTCSRCAIGLTPDADSLSEAGLLFNEEVKPPPKQFIKLWNETVSMTKIE